MESRISATEAARSFSELLNRVWYRGDSFIVERGGQAVCRIEHVGGAMRTIRELVRLLEAAPRPDGEYLDELEQLVRNQPELPHEPWGS